MTDFEAEVTARDNREGIPYVHWAIWQDGRAVSSTTPVYRWREMMANAMLPEVTEAAEPAEDECPE